MAAGLTDRIWRVRELQGRIRWIRSLIRVGAEIISRYDQDRLSEIGFRSPRYSISVSLALQVAWVTQP